MKRISTLNAEDVFTVILIILSEGRIDYETD